MSLSRFAVISVVLALVPALDGRSESDDAVKGEESRQVGPKLLSNDFEPVSLTSVIVHPKRHHDQYILVRGYLADHGLPALMLFITKEHAEMRDYESAIPVKNEMGRELPLSESSCVGKHVLMHGHFVREPALIPKFDVDDLDKGVRCWRPAE